MPPEPDIHIIRRGGRRHLERFIRNIEAAEGGADWRCFYCALDPALATVPGRRSIVLSFLKAALGEADESKVFWLAGGHLFVFFRGPVRPLIRGCEDFLERVTERDARAEYHFFWELGRFRGYFDQALAGLIGEAPVEPVSGYARRKRQKPDGNRLSLVRKSRYKPLLLIVEDDRAARHFLQAVMEKYCDIVVAWNAAQARKIYADRLPNLAFLDIMLPDGDGTALAEEFCSQDPDSFVVMVSGRISRTAMENCLEAGVRGFVAKPVAEAPLLHFIDLYHRERRTAARRRV